RGRADAPTLEACTAFGPAELVAERLEQYVRSGGSKFVLRPMGPPERVLDQLPGLAAQGVPAFPARRGPPRVCALQAVAELGLRRPRRTYEWRIWSRSSGSTLPPESTTPTRAPRGTPSLPVSTAAAPTAPVGSTMMRTRSARNRTAATISASLTSTTLVRFWRRIGNVSFPGDCGRIPSAIVGGGGIVTRSPFCSDR